RIITDPELEEKMGIESKKIIKEGYTYKHMISQFREAIETITAKDSEE
ncbi:unnamed protein product, partial [marine sediment metagenome]